MARALTKLDPAHKNRFQLLHAQHSEEIMDLVRTGEADAGIVYRADAINSGNVRIIDENPAGTHTPVYFGKRWCGLVVRHPLLSRMSLWIS